MSNRPKGADMGNMSMRRTVAIVATTLALSLIAVAAGATPLGTSVALDVQGPGLSVAEGGVGLESLGAGSETITISIPGSTQSALLYWTGRNLTGCPDGDCFEAPNTQPFGDQELVFDGTPITGAISGTEAGTGGNIGYVADVTSIVQAKGIGLQSFSIEDGDTSNNLQRLNGAGLVVIYTDASDPSEYRIVLYDGLDFAWEGGPSAENMVTSPVTFNFVPTGAARSGQLTYFVGDSEAARPDRIDISDNPSIINALDRSDGNSYDTDTFAVDIPAGATQLTTQVHSLPAGQNPDSLLWQLTLLRLPIPQVPRGDEGCTPGYWKNHTDSWGPSGFSPGQTVGSVFTVPANLSSFSSQTLLQALGGGGGPGVTGGAKILLRAGVAALLNASHPDVASPNSATDVIDGVNAALASNDRDAMLDLASALDADNNLGCPLN